MLQKVEVRSSFCNTLQQLTTYFIVARQVVRGMKKAQHRFSATFVEMLREKLDVSVARITVALDKEHY